MSEVFAREFFVTLWSTVLVRGLVSLAFGIIAFLYPGVTIGILVTIFGIYAIADGILALWTALRSRGNGNGSNGFVTILQAIAGVIAGLFCLIMPDIAAAYLVILIGIWNMAVGVLQIVAAVTLRDEIDGAFWLGLSGLASFLLGLLIAFYPATGALSLIWLIAGTAVFVGLILIAFALRLRGMGKRIAAR